MFSIKAISDKTEIGQVEEAWDRFVLGHTENPYLLHEFPNNYMELKHSGTVDPLFLIGYDNDEIVGIAPLMTKRMFGARIARSVLRNSPSFIVEDRFRTRFIQGLLDLIFQTVRCKAVDLIFPTEAPELHALEEQCQVKGVFFAAMPFMGCRVLAVKGGWKEFESVQGGDFKRRFRKMENKLNRAGHFSVVRSECEKEGSDVFDKIVDVDRASWKEKWRIQKSITDPDLLITWKAAVKAARNVAGFKNKVWILELNRQPIAFALVLQNRQTASILKTSYDARFRNFYPGMFTIHSAIRDLFNEGSVRKIDFVTDLPFMKAWTETCENRKEILLGKDFIVKGIFQFSTNEHVKKATQALLNTSLGRLLPKSMYSF